MVFLWADVSIKFETITYLQITMFGRVLLIIKPQFKLVINPFWNDERSMTIEPLNVLAKIAKHIADEFTKSRVNVTACIGVIDVFKNILIKKIKKNKFNIKTKFV